MFSFKTQNVPFSFFCVTILGSPGSGKFSSPFWKNFPITVFFFFRWGGEAEGLNWLLKFLKILGRYLREELFRFDNVETFFAKKCFESVNTYDVILFLAIKGEGGKN